VVGQAFGGGTHANAGRGLTRLMDLMVTLGGIAYGAVLVCAAFCRNRFTEALRIDALIVPEPNEATRRINPGIGLLLLAYYAYSLLG
jgi:Na+-transporting NADH:ubiquinone oxidoreductase subunit NqrD